MDKKVFLAVALCAVIYLLWANIYMKPFQQGAPQAPVAAQPQAQPEKPVMTAVKEPAKSAGESRVRLGDDGYGAIISTKGGVVESVTLAEYRGSNTGTLQQLIGGTHDLEITTPSPEWAYLSDVVYRVQSGPSAGQPGDKLVLVYDDANVAIQRSYTLNRSLFYIDHSMTAEFKKPAPAYLFIGLRAWTNVAKEAAENERREILFDKKSGGSQTWAVTDIDEPKEDLSAVSWTGFSSRYFLKAVLDRSSGTAPQFQTRKLAPTGEVAASLIYQVTGKTASIPTRMYYGPKEIDTLTAVSPEMRSAVDFGWFTVFAYPLLQALKWFYKYVHNFGIAIILLTIGVKVLLYPLTYKSMKSMKEMQRIQPQLQKLRERYKDDKERLNKETLQLMRANGYNPMSGCLPILVQMPIFVALYNVLYGAIDLYGQPFFGWIHDLSAKDPFYVTPILLAGMMYLQQKITPNTATDPAQQRMMQLMPVIFGFMMLWLPSGLTLYMLVNSVVSILQQLWIYRKLGSHTPVAAAA